MAQVWLKRMPVVGPDVPRSAVLMRPKRNVVSTGRGMATQSRSPQESC